MPADLNEYFNKKKGNSSGGGNTPKPEISKGMMTIYVIGGLIALLIFAKPFIVINSGEVGIKVRTGKFDETPLKAGLHLFIPVFERIIPVNTRIRLITYSNERSQSIGDNYSNKFSGSGFEGGLKRNSAIGVLDKRGLTVNIDLAVQYQLKAETAPKTIEKWGSSWEEKIINSKVREVVRDVVGQYTAEQLPEMRNEIASAIQTKVRQKVEALGNQPVVLSSVELRNIVLPSRIKAKIEEVQAAKQDVTIAEQQNEKAKQTAKKNAEIARGEAERNRIVAQGEADKIRIEAEEQAKANRLISESLTKNLLLLKQIEVQGKFNEALKVNKDAKIFLTPGGSTPNIWVDTKNQRTMMGER